MTTPLDVAVTQLGVTDPSAYWSVIWPNRPADAQEWCACFVSWCFEQAGTPLPKMDETAVTSGFVYCPDAETWAQDHGAWSSTGEPGDIVLYCWDGSGTAEHTGIVETVNADGSIVAIEGNTEPSSDYPPGVYRMDRDPSVILGFITPPVTSAPAPAVATHELIDLASFQHPGNAPIDWAQVKAAGIEGVIVKLTEGVSYVNPWIDRSQNPLGADDIADAQAAGLVVSGYHFLHPEIDGVSQAQFCLANGGSRVSGIWIDAEVTDSQTWATIETDMQRCHDYLALQAGKAAGAYVNQTWYAATGIGSWGWYVWLAAPSDSAPPDPCVNWQYGTSTVAGIEGQVDRDRWVGTEDVYRAFFGAVASTQPTPSPEPTPAPTPTPTPEPTPSPTPDPTPAPSGGDVPLPTVSQGSSLTYWVQTVQALLKDKMGQTTLAVDGSFGPLTEEAVKTVQGFFGVTVDGIVGPVTWSILLGL